MTILEGDILLLASERLHDDDDGGGAMTGNEIATNQHNTLFPDISDLDRAYGRLNLRKGFFSVDTDSNDVYYGAHVIVRKPPADSKVAVSLFSTGSHFDERYDAASRVEAYLFKGSSWGGYLFEDHIQGQKAITLFQRPNSDLPYIGQTLVVMQNEGKSNEYYQYVRVIDVEYTVQTFTISTSSGFVDFQAWVVVCGISDALRYDFTGSPASRLFQVATGAATIRDTRVADAAEYFGIAPLTANTAVGDYSASVESIYAQLVPSAQTEVSIPNANAYGVSNFYFDGSATKANYTTTASLAASTMLYLGSPVVPGTLGIAYSSSLVKDDSAGNLTYNGSQVGTIDYSKGICTFIGDAITGGNTKTITFSVAGNYSAVSGTDSIDVSDASRAFNYNHTLPSTPQAGTLTLSYMSQGKWYELKDRGDGKLVGTSSSYGAGVLNFTTKTFSVTLGAMPDADTSILLTWGKKAILSNRSNIVPEKPKIAIQLDHYPAVPTMVSVTWLNGANTYTLTDNGLGKMMLAGVQAGIIHYPSGLITLQLPTLPVAGASFKVTYDYGDPDTETITDVIMQGESASFYLAKTNLVPHSVEVSFNLDYYLRYGYYGSNSNEQGIETGTANNGQVDPQFTIVGRDDGAGALWDAAGKQVGTINYTTGIVTLITRYITTVPVRAYVPITKTGRGWSLFGGHYTYTYTTYELQDTVAQNVQFTWPTDGSQTATVKYRAVLDSNHIQDAVYQIGLGLLLDITPYYMERIVTNSVMFSLGGVQYFDRDGYIYRDLDVKTGSAVEAGSINYVTGRVTLSSWTGGGSATPVLYALTSTADDVPLFNVSFRIPVAPVRVSSVQITATSSYGGQLTGTTDSDGRVNGDRMQGVIDYETGVVHVFFGYWALATDYPTLPAVDGKVFISSPVVPDSIRYNAVAYSYLPLDADILKVDPVRLPSDGKVPMFKKGYLAVIHEEDKLQLPNPVPAGHAGALGAVRVVKAWVTDANNNIVDPALYTVNLNLGTYTFATPLNLSAYTQPLSWNFRFEDMALLTDADLSGRLSFSKQLSHVYHAGKAYVSSALIIDDLWARVSNVFDQQTWSNAWSDSVSGSGAAAQFNNTDFPITVQNRGPVTERFALVFATTTTFSVYGEHLGLIATGNINEDCAPLNPNTHTPYFTINKLAWGTGWAAGNALRFNVKGANAPFWIARTILQSDAEILDDSFTLQMRGNVNR